MCGDWWVQHKMEKFLLVITLSLTIACCSGKDLTPEKLKKSYQKINEHLLEKVSTDDPEINMSMVEDMLTEQQSKCTLLCGGSLLKTLEKLYQLEHMPKKADYCGTLAGIKLMELLDSGLADETKSQIPNYPVSRVEQMIAHYIIKNTQVCFENIKSFSGIVYAFKRHTYDLINAHLVDALPRDQDIVANMAKAENLLHSLGHNSEGALAVALKQFLRLGETVDSDTCNQMGYQILYLNDLATRGNAHAWEDEPLRRIDKIFQHYARQHEQLCFDIFREKFEEELTRLNPDTYRRMLAWASSHYLSPYELSNTMANVNHHDIDEDFIVPEVLQVAEVKLATPGRNYADLEVPYRLDIQQIYYYLRVVSGEDARYLKSVVDEKRGERGVNEEKVEMLLRKFLLEPCSDFLKKFEHLIQADEYGSGQNLHHTQSAIDKFIDELSYHMVRTAYKSCQLVSANKGYVLGKIKGIVKSNKDN